jgi:hypothetical protein
MTRSNDNHISFRRIMQYRVDPTPLVLVLTFCAWTVLVHLGIWCAS